MLQLTRKRNNVHGNTNTTLLVNNISDHADSIRFTTAHPIIIPIGNIIPDFNQIIPDRLSLRDF
jgi:hypothetical protein